MNYTFDIEALSYDVLTLDAVIPAPPNTMEHPGSYAVVLREEALSRRYNRVGLALKLIPLGPAEHPGLALWDGVELGMASLVQNLLAQAGLAPRVYGLALVNGTHAAQITDYVTEGDHLPRIPDLMRTFKHLGVQTRKNWDASPNRGNWRNGLFVDFSGLYLTGEAVDTLVGWVHERATLKKGVPAGSAYQEVRALGIPGDRPSTREFPDGLPLDGMSVLDIGCNLGHFSRLAVDRGAVRVVGVDRGETALLCRFIHTLLGYWGVDVVDATLPKEESLLPHIAFDVAVCLSAVKYLGDAAAVPWLAHLAPTLWLEGHGDIEVDHYLPALEQSYQTVERLADATDNKCRAQFLCTNGGDSEDE